MIQSICDKSNPPNNLNLKDPTSFFMQLIFRPFQGWNRGPSDPEADDVPMCHRASLTLTSPIHLPQIIREQSKKYKII